MGYLKKKKNTIPKHILISTLIRVLIKNKNSQKESRERKREYSQFCVGKIWIEWENDIKFIQNKMGRRRVKI